MGFYQTEMEGSIVGKVNADAIEESEVIVVTIPPKATVSVFTQLREHMTEDQIIISTVVPMTRRDKLFYFSSLEEEGVDDSRAGSAAEVIQEIVKPIPARARLFRRSRRLT